jgi:hypothetical protein
LGYGRLESQIGVEVFGAAVRGKQAITRVVNIRNAGHAFNLS